MIRGSGLFSLHSVNSTRGCVIPFPKKIPEICVYAFIPYTQDHARTSEETEHGGWLAKGK